MKLLFSFLVLLGLNSANAASKCEHQVKNLLGSHGFGIMPGRNPLFLQPGEEGMAAYGDPVNTYKFPVEVYIVAKSNGYVLQYFGYFVNPSDCQILGRTSLGDSDGSDPFH